MLLFSKNAMALEVNEPESMDVNSRGSLLNNSDKNNTSDPMNSNKFFSDYFIKIDEKIRSIDIALLEQCAQLILKMHLSKRKLLIVGNGGSAAMASHLSVDFLKTAGIRAMNFNEANLITCFSNDYGYERWVEKAFEMYADPGDLAVIISSSGCSPNLINAALKAREMQMNIITVTGFKADNTLRTLGDINLWVDSDSYNIVEMTHHVWLLAIVDYLVANKVNGL